MENVAHKVKRIVIQGGYGAFHEIAALRYFKGEEIEIVPRDTFKDLFHSLNNNQADYGITAIENSLAGSILPNYMLLQESNMKIIGEIYLRIKQNLICLPGQKIGDIKEIYSHPMAILQCQQFLNKYPKIKVVESLDTALSAKDIRENNLIGVGAIASKLAANMYELEIIAESIETNRLNYTRFLILADKNEDIKLKAPVNKASINFSLAHKIGGLSKILSILSFYGINLSKIQSMPIPGKDWEYQFFIDVEIEDYALYKQSIEAIKPFTSNLGIMGEYVKGDSVIE